MDKSIIKRVPLFSSLPSTEIDLLAAELKERRYPAKTILFREGEHGDKFYIVLDGQIEVLKAMDSTSERLLALRGPGEFIGEMSLLNRDGLRTASARVHSQSRLLELTRANFDDLLARKPTIAYEMLRVLSARLQEAHNESIRELKEKNRKLAEAYESLKAAQEQIIQKEILERELMQAREIQESMLPRVLPPFDGFDIGVRMLPARMVGGDFFDVMLLDEDHLGLVIGDVSGKGVPAALFMALTRSLLRAEASLNAPPARVLGRVNHLLLEMNARGLFVTILYGILKRTTGEFDYVRAGHELPLVWDRRGEIVPTEKTAGQPLGLFNQPVLEPQRLTMPKGGTLLLFTDGVTEACSPQGDFFDDTGLESAAQALLSLPAQALCDALMRSLEDFQGEGSQDDDITVMAVKSIA